MTNEQLEKWAVYLAIVGAILVALSSKISLIGWVLWVISSMFFIKFAINNQYWYIWKQHVVFIGINLFGIYRNISNFWT